MKKTLIAAALVAAFAAPAHAQQPERPTDAQIAGEMSALRAQRNEAQDTIARANGVISELHAQIKAAREELAAAKKEPEKKKPEVIQ